MSTSAGLAPGLLLLPHVAIGLCWWLAHILALNRFHKMRVFSTAERLALALHLGAGLVRTTASLGTRFGSFHVQVSAALVGTTMSWAAFVLIYNDKVVLPSRQQLHAAGFDLVRACLWETINRMVQLL